MTLFWIIIPLALLAIGIAVLPVLIGSFRHDRSVKEGTPATTQAAVREVNQWAPRLGRRMRRPGHVTPRFMAQAAGKVERFTGPRIVVCSPSSKSGRDETSIETANPQNFVRLRP